MGKRQASKGLSSWQKATALVPLALLSGAWTAGIAATSSASASPTQTTTLPDGTTVPNQALEAPASMTRPGSIAPGVPEGAAETVIASASTNGIPAAALAAYQRAEQVINAADAGCNLSWQLVAAIGRVESDHGRYGGNVLGEDGRSRPGIYGIPLDGSNGTAEIRDSDAGQYDDDQVYDRAVGPMQFIPQTWSVVGVDGDGDGVRDPQDIDDAALASAVYLCSGQEDLATYGGQKAAVYRYNHSQEYVDLVISIMNAYLAGDFSSVPNGVAGATVFTRRVEAAVPTASGDRRTESGDSTRRGTGDDPRRPDGSGAPRPTDDGTGGEDEESDVTPEVPSDGPSEDTGDTVEKTVKDTTGTVSETTDPVKETVDKVVEESARTLTRDEAEAECLASGITTLQAIKLAACVEDLLH